jgi:hypothetical protein
VFDAIIVGIYLPADPPKTLPVKLSRLKAIKSLLFCSLLANAISATATEFPEGRRFPLMQKFIKPCAKQQVTIKIPKLAIVEIIGIKKGASSIEGGEDA